MNKNNVIDKSIFLGPEASSRVRRMMRNACDRYDIGVRELLEDLGLIDELAVSTVSRAFSVSSTSNIRRNHLNHFIQWVAKRTSIDVTTIETWVYTGKTGDLELCKLTAAKVYTHTAANLTAWDADLDALKSRAKQCFMLTEVPSASMLSEEVSQAICQLRTSSFHSFRLESAFAENRAMRIEGLQEIGSFRPVQILSRLGVEEAINGLKAPELRDRFIETLLYRHECELVTLAYIDDRPGRSGNFLRQVFSQFDIRAIFDDSICVRRERNGLRRYLYDATQSPDQAAVVEEDRELLRKALLVAIFDFPLIKKWLIAFTSEDSWLRRRMEHDAA